MRALTLACAMQPAMLMEVTAMEIIVIGAMLVLGVLLGLAVKIYDLKRKREEEAVAAQARVSDALLMDAALAGLPLTPTARLPLWKGSPLVLDITGVVPRTELREAALDVAKRELGRSRSDFRIEDRIAVNRGALGHAA
ncbi:MAG TPA: hypothetical protein VK878_01195 [Candidatus Deferrimicrobiaceae bacterium]|nr:hypothetical protein [Candidatus Deferrimicrobiaceae bacterium]